MFDNMATLRRDLDKARAVGDRHEVMVEEVKALLDDRDQLGDRHYDSERARTTRSFVIFCLVVGVGRSLHP